MTRLRYSPDHYELIVVDDGGPESLESVVGRFRALLPLVLLRRDHGGPGSARNAGAEAARGRFLAFTADDCEPAADWLTALKRAGAAGDVITFVSPAEEERLHEIETELGITLPRITVRGFAASRVAAPARGTARPRNGQASPRRGRRRRRKAAV